MCVSWFFFANPIYLIFKEISTFSETLRHIWRFFCCTPEQAMAPHSSTLAWKIPWTEEPGGLQSMGSLRVGHDWATSLSCIGEGNGNPLQCSCLENPRDGGACWAAVYGVAQSRTRLKRLSSCCTHHCFPCVGYCFIFFPKQAFAGPLNVIMTTQ